ncbi:carboxypeptidase-like regulatory domain-containing protein [Ferroplasma sp.]|uniref:carboxypeptidase-like regulatory domain-containing protein n=1 Tax=Ferroplasma sp. TaxID=2591003 RepID=UPI00307D5A3A
MNKKVLIAIAISGILIALVFSGANIVYPGHGPVDRVLLGKGTHGSGNNTKGNNTSGNNTSGNNTVPPAIVNQNFTLSGNVSDSYNNLTVNGTITVSNSTMSRTINIGKNGSYNITLPRGNYSVTASSLAFYNKSVQINLDSNKTLNPSITPVNYIGNGTGLFSGKQSIESKNISNIVPYLTNSNLTNNKTLQGLNSNDVTGILNKNITVELGSKNANTKFVILIEQNGAVYNYTGITNSNGNGTIFLKYAGNYSMSAYTLNYSSSFKNYSISENRSYIKFDMTRLRENDYTIVLRSAVVLNGSLAVENSTLSGKGGIFNVAYSNMTENSTGTYYNYSVPFGFYNFNYMNSNYVTKYFNLTPSSNSTINEIVNPYLISVNVTNNSGKLYHYIISGKNDTGNNTYMVSAGTYNVDLYIKSSYLCSQTVNINKSDPYYKLNFTINNSTINLTGEEDQDPGYLNITYSGNITSNMIITSMHFENYTTDKTDGILTISGKNYGLKNSYVYNFTPFVNVSAGPVIITLVYDHDNNVETSGLMIVEITGYDIAKSGYYIKE